MKFRSKAPVEQDFVNDLEGATQAEEGMGLHHEKILSLLHTLNIIPLAVQTDTPAVAEQHNGDGGAADNADDNDDGIFFDTKDDILIETLRSIRSSLNITIVNDSPLYSPKSCPICCDDYAKGDDIAWSKNEQCVSYGLYYTMVDESR